MEYQKPTFPSSFRRKEKKLIKNYLQIWARRIDLNRFKFHYWSFSFSGKIRTFLSYEVCTWKMWPFHLHTTKHSHFSTRLIITRTMSQYLALSLGPSFLSPSQTTFSQTTLQQWRSTSSSYLRPASPRVLTSRTSTRAISPIHILVANGPTWPRREATRSLSSRTPTRRARRARH